MISYIIPTHNRPEHLALTLGVLGRLSRADHERIGGAEVIVVDNASRFPPTPPKQLANGLPVHLLLRGRNDGAAARNAAARHASGEWLIMLDDDSHPMDTGFIDELIDVPADVAAIGAEIFLPSRPLEPWPRSTAGAASGRSINTRESGGLPEVFIGCGVAMRRSVFLDPFLGDTASTELNGAGYDPAFNYYAEEYDLAARMILAGFRVTHSRNFRVLHHKVSTGRDMHTILRRLVRNNAWVEQRYAPEADRRAAVQRVVSRYRAIAEKENALEGYLLGLGDLDDTLDAQTRLPMNAEQYDRFTGVAAARSHLAQLLCGLGARTAAIVEPGKNEWAVRRAIEHIGITLTADTDSADALVIGTLSPGPMLDAAERLSAAGASKPVVTPWSMETGPTPARLAA